jgi:hypothetical protein
MVGLSSIHAACRRVCPECCQIKIASGFRADCSKRQVCSGCASKFRRQRLRKERNKKKRKKRKRGAQAKPLPVPQHTAKRARCHHPDCSQAECKLWHPEELGMVDESTIVRLVESPPACPNCADEARSISCTSKLGGFWLNAAIYLTCNVCGNDLPEPLILQDALPTPASPEPRGAAPVLESVVLPHGACPHHNMPCHTSSQYPAPLRHCTTVPQPP